MICRKLHNEWCRLASEHFCFLKDNTGADDCCDANKVRACSNPSAVVKECTCDHCNDRELRTTRNKCCSHDCHFTVTVVLDCTGSHNSRNTTSGTDQHWNKGFSGKTEFTEDSVHDECNTSHVTAGLKECKEQEQNQHLRYETKYSANTGNNTVKDQSLQPCSAIYSFQSRLNCRRNNLTEEYIICPICYNSSNSGYRHIINNPHYNCEDRKRQPSVGYDSVDLIGGCKFLSCRGFCIALSNNGRDIYITLVCDNTLCIIIEFIFQSLYFVRHIRNTLHLLYDLVIFLDKLDCKETFLSLCNSSCQLILNRFDRILNILCKFVNRNCFLFALCCADCFLSSFHDSGSFQSGNLNYFAAKLFA